jgi:phage shock protein C
MNGKKLYKKRNGKICGVCGGIGEYLNIDPVILRVLWLIFAFSGIGLLAYFACAIVMPFADQF